MEGEDQEMEKENENGDQHLSQDAECKCGQSLELDGVGGQAITVLLVEDDPMTSRIVETLLKTCLYEVVVASNGREALEILEGDLGQTIDVILTDNLMPEVSGIELIYKLVQAERWQQVPVIVMSSESRQDVVLEAFEAGASDFLIKPIKRSELTALWQHVWRAHGGAQRSRSSDTSSDQPMVGTSNPGRQPTVPATQRRASKEDGSQERTSPATAPAAPQVLPFQQPSNLPSPMELLQPEGKGTRIMDQLTQAAALNAKERLQRHNDYAQHNPMKQVAAKATTSGAGGAQGFPTPAKTGPETQSSAAALAGSLEPAAGGSKAHGTCGAQSLPTSWQASVEGAAQMMAMLARSARGGASRASGEPLEIKPLNLTLTPLALGSSSRPASMELPQLPYSSIVHNGMRAKSVPSGKEGEGLAGSLSMLHHSNSHSAFSSFTAVVPRPCARGEAKVAERNGHTLENGRSSTMPPVFSTTPGFQQQQQSFFQAFQAALGRHQSSVEACAANRKAAIVKFRAKRKQRNFEKKVRYASRQRLAETRPRVRGQFVKADVYAAHRAASGEAPTPSPAAAVEACVG